MNYSNPDYGGMGQQDTYSNMPPQQQEPYYGQQSFTLTPEEKRVLQECSREGIFKRAIPMGISFGLMGLFGARAGPLMSSKFGVKPAVIGLGAVGYFIGRLSYSSTCMQRILNVPDGNLRKIMIERGGLPSNPRDNMELPYNRQDPSNFYATIDVPKDEQEPVWETKRRENSDIELPTTSSFDTIPSEYYAEVDQPAEEIKPKNYTSYDDLRNRNRQDFKSRMYPSDNPQRFRGPEVPQVVRPSVPDVPPVSQTGSHQTKYGDAWD